MIIYVVLIVHPYSIYGHEKCIKNLKCRDGSPGKMTISHGMSWNFALEFLYEPCLMLIKLVKMLHYSHSLLCNNIPGLWNMVWHFLSGAI